MDASQKVMIATLILIGVALALQKSCVGGLPPPLQPDTRIAAEAAGKESDQSTVQSGQKSDQKSRYKSSQKHYKAGNIEKLRRKAHKCRR